MNYNDLIYIFCSIISRFSVTYAGEGSWYSQRLLSTLSTAVSERVEVSPAVELVDCKPGRYLARNKLTLGAGKSRSAESWEYYPSSTGKRKKKSQNFLDTSSQSSKEWITDKLQKTVSHQTSEVMWLVLEISIIWVEIHCQDFQKRVVGRGVQQL